MLKSNKQKDAAITLIINEIARRTKRVAETKELLRSLPKATQNATAAIIAQLIKLIALITAQLAALEQQEK